MLRFIGSDEYIIPNLTDNFNRNIFMFRICHRNEIRMVAIQNLPAGTATAAAALLAENCRSQQPCQRVFSGAFLTGNQIKMGDMPPTQAAC